MSKTAVVLSLLIVVSGFILSGCNSDTMEGFGRDVQKVGERIEN